MRIRHITSAAIALIALLTATDGSAQTVLSLDAAREIARSEAVQVESAEALVASASARVREARAQMLMPRVTVSASVEQADREIAIELPEVPGLDVASPVIQHDRQALLAASVDLALFDMQALTRVQAARSVVDAGQATIDAVADALELATIELWIRRSTLEAYDELIRAQIELQQAHIANLERRAEQGLATAFEVRRAETRVLELETDSTELTQAQTELEIALAEILGNASDPRFPSDWHLDALPVPDSTVSANPESLVSEARSLRSDLVGAQLQLDAANRLAAAEREAIVPDILLDARAAYSSEEAIDGEHHQWLVRLSVLWVPFDRGLRRARTDAAEATVAELESDYLQRRASIESDVRTAVSELATAEQRVELAQAQRDIAADTLSLANSAYLEGTATSLDVQQAQTVSLASQIAVLAAESEHAIARWRLEWASGRL